MKKTAARGIIPPAPFCLLEALRSTGVSQRKLAMALGVDEGHVSKLTRGLIRPQWSTAVAIALALRIPLESLLGSERGGKPRRRRRVG